MAEKYISNSKTLIYGRPFSSNNNSMNENKIQINIRLIDLKNESERRKTYLPIS